MPKVTGPCFSLSAAKSLKKTITYQKRPSGHAVYPFKKPGDRQPFAYSLKQLAQRDRIRQLVSDWQAVTAAIKTLWDEAAESAGFIGAGYHYFIHKGGAGLVVTAGPSADARLLETGDYRLLETGDYRLLE